VVRQSCEAPVVVTLPTVSVLSFKASGTVPTAAPARAPLGAPSFAASLSPARLLRCAYRPPVLGDRSASCARACEFDVSSHYAGQRSAAWKELAALRFAHALAEIRDGPSGEPAQLRHFCLRLAAELLSLKFRQPEPQLVAILG
jgi:hypothetical protein